MLPPVFPRLHRGVGVATGVRALAIGLSYGLAFAGAAALAHHAGTAWSPKPAWDVPSAGRVEPDVAATTEPVVVEVAPAVEPTVIPARTRCANHTASGLGYTELAPGGRQVTLGGTPQTIHGRHPTADDSVEVVFAGWDADGKPLPALPADGHAVFRVGSLIPGWVEGLALMEPGARMRLCIPEELAYQGRPGAPTGTLEFDVLLLGIEPALIAR